MQSSKELEEYKKTIISELTEKLHSYLHSPEGREHILNPPDTKGICEVSYICLSGEVPARLKSGIQRWCKGQEVKQIIDDADTKIRAHVEDILSKLQEIELVMTGPDTSVQYSPNSSIIFLGLLLLPLAIVISVAFALISVPLFWGGYLIFGSDLYRKTADMIYDSCLSQISTSVLEESFEKSVGAEYSKVIISIFDKSLPNVLNSLIATNERLLDTHKDIKQKQESFVRLGDKISKIQEATKDFEKKY